MCHEPGPARTSTATAAPLPAGPWATPDIHPSEECGLAALGGGSQPKSPATSLSLSFSHTTSLTSRHLVSVLRIRVGLQLPRRRLYPLSRRSWSPPPHGTLTVSTTSCFQKSLAGEHFGNDHTTNNLLATSCYPISPRLICSSQVHSEDMTGSSRLHPT